MRFGKTTGLVISLLLCGVEANAGVGRAATQALDTTVWWGRDAYDPDWVQGRVRLPADAARLWARIQAVDDWTAIFSDVLKLTVVERTPPRWRVRVETRSFDCGEHDYHVVFQQRNTVEMRIAAPGVESVGYLSVAEDPSGGVLVTYRLLVRPQGFGGWFVSKKELQRKQEDMVVRYLRDVRRLSEAMVESPAAATDGQSGVARVRRRFTRTAHHSRGSRAEGPAGTLRWFRSDGSRLGDARRRASAQAGAVPRRAPGRRCRPLRLLHRIERRGTESAGGSRGTEPQAGRSRSSAGWRRPTRRTRPPCSRCGEGLGTLLTETGVDAAEERTRHDARRAGAAFRLPLA